MRVRDGFELEGDIEQLLGTVLVTHRWHRALLSTCSQEARP